MQIAPKLFARTAYRRYPTQLHSEIVNGHSEYANIVGLNLTYDKLRIND